VQLYRHADPCWANVRLVLGFDLLTSGSEHAGSYHELCLPTLVLISQAIFLLEHKQTDASECPTPSQWLYSRCG